MITIPNEIPQLGFYYHAKHDPDEGVEHYAYEVASIQIDTETDTLSRVSYRPLYEEANAWKVGRNLRTSCAYSGTFGKFFGTFKKGDVHVPRFQRVVDEKIVTELSKIRNQMYGAPSTSSKKEMALALLEDLGLNIPDLGEGPNLRLHDDHDGTFKGQINVGQGPDGDMWLSTDTNLGQSLRFRVPMIGGGASPLTHNALLLLALAIKLDNEHYPQQRP